MSTRKENMTTKKCVRCKIDKPLDAFNYNKLAKDNKQSYCQACMSDIHTIRRMDPKIKKHEAANHARYMKEVWCKNPQNKTAQQIRIRNSTTLTALINNFDGVREETVQKAFNIDKQGFMNHLENLFEPGMSWNNYGAWHLDHKINLSDFNLLDPKVVKKANHYTNIRPMWATGEKGNLTRKKSPRMYY